MAIWVVLIVASFSCGGCDDSTASNNTIDRGRDVGKDLQKDLSKDGNGRDVVVMKDLQNDADVEDCTILCGDICCDAGLECFEDRCLEPCTGERCGADSTICCHNSEVCLGDQCLVPGSDCVNTEECKVDEICEPTINKCIPRDAVEVCEFRPPVGVLQPDLSCSWPPPMLAEFGTSNRVVIAPIVGNLTDDNGDGTKWEVLWRNATYPTFNVHTRGGATVSIADLDADGKPEVIVGCEDKNSGEKTVLCRVIM